MRLFSCNKRKDAGELMRFYNFLLLEKISQRVSANRVWLQINSYKYPYSTSYLFGPIRLIASWMLKCYRESVFSSTQLLTHFVDVANE